MAELNLPVERGEKIGEWKKVKKLEMTAPSVIYYFNYKYFNETGTLYPIKNENWHKLGNEIKKHVLDEMIIRGFGIEEVQEFIDWVFSLRPSKWKFDLMRYHIADWIKTRAIKQKKSIGSLDERLRTKRQEEEQLAKYFGEGYFDDLLTQTQYFLGLAWRIKHLSQEERDKIGAWQEKNFTADVLQRLQGYRVKYSIIQDGFNAKRWFYVELAKKRDENLKHLLNEFGRTKLYSLYTTEELERRW